VAELTRRWIEADPGKRANTLTRDGLVIRLYILPTLGQARLDEISQPDVQSLATGWAKERAPRTVRRDYAVLRAIFAYAVASDWLARSPCRDIKLPAIETTERRQITPEEVSGIAGAVGTHYAPMVWLGALWGCTGERSRASRSVTSTSCEGPSASSNSGPLMALLVHRSPGPAAGH
jgi:integrase